MQNNHFPGHQQALLKNNICIAVLAFTEHEQQNIADTIAKFDCDKVINLCDFQKDAWLDSLFNGVEFIIKPYSNWVLDEASLSWKAPFNSPNDGKVYYWNEEQSNWIICEPCQEPQLDDPTAN